MIKYLIQCGISYAGGSLAVIGYYQHKNWTLVAGLLLIAVGCASPIVEYYKKRRELND